jgi:hypothetical protein
MALLLLESAPEGDSVIRGLLVVVGSMLLCASVASGAGSLIVVEQGVSTSWLHYTHVLALVAGVGPRSEPMGLVLLGCGFVLVAYQIRRKR